MNLPDNIRLLLKDTFTEAKISEDEQKSVQSVKKTGKPTAEFIQANIFRWERSETRKFLDICKDYEQVENTAISHKQRFYVNDDGERAEMPHASNNKLKHPKVPQLAKQKIGYLMSQPITVTAEDVDGELQDILSDFYDESFMRWFKRVGHHAIHFATSWVQVYYDEYNNFRYKRIPTTEVIPIWRDVDQQELEAVIRHYHIDEIQPDGSIEKIEKAEYYTEDGVWYFARKPGDSDFVTDTTPGDGVDGQHGHFKVFVDPKQFKDPKRKATLKSLGITPDKIEGKEVNENGEVPLEMTWGKIPFIPFKYNAEGIPLLQMVKSLVDEYDLASSELADMISDEPHAIKVIKGYADEADRSAKNINETRIVFVDGEYGGMEILKNEIDSEVYEAHLDRVNSQIFEAGSGVDINNDKFGTQSGLAIKYHYTMLDLDCRDFSYELIAGLKDFNHFLMVDLFLKGEVDQDMLKNEEVSFRFNTTSLVNDYEFMQMIEMSLGILSDQTIVERNPLAAPDEIDRLTKEKEEGQFRFMINEEMDNQATGGMQGEVADAKPYDRRVADNLNRLQKGKDRNATRSQPSTKPGDHK